MKKAKKLASLFLAMLMAFSLMAVTAAAYGAEEHEHVCSVEAIQPRLPARECLECGVTMRTSSPYWEGGKRYIDFTCPKCDTTIRVPYLRDTSQMT